MKKIYKNVLCVEDYWAHHSNTKEKTRLLFKAGNNYRHEQSKFSLSGEGGCFVLMTQDIYDKHFQAL